MATSTVEPRKPLLTYEDKKVFEPPDPVSRANAHGAYLANTRFRSRRSLNSRIGIRSSFIGGKSQ